MLKIPTFFTRTEVLSSTALPNVLRRTVGRKVLFFVQKDLHNNFSYLNNCLANFYIVLNQCREIHEILIICLLIHLIVIKKFNKQIGKQMINIYLQRTKVITLL